MKKQMYMLQTALLFLLGCSAFSFVQGGKTELRYYLSHTYAALSCRADAQRDAVLFNAAASCLSQCLVEKPAGDIACDLQQQDTIVFSRIVFNVEESCPDCPRSFYASRAPPLC